MRWLDGIIDTMNRNLGKLREGQGGLACCSPWGQKESDTTGRLNNNNNKTCMNPQHLGMRLCLEMGLFQR